MVLDATGIVALIPIIAAIWSIIIVVAKDLTCGSQSSIGFDLRHMLGAEASDS